MRRRVARDEVREEGEVQIVVILILTLSRECAEHTRLSNRTVK